MPKFAQYDPSHGSPAAVIGWYDTDQFEYPNLPKDGLIIVTDDQWKKHFADPSAWQVSNGSLVEESK
ncbi:hypothetical protein [Burkholderia multivorans]|uniref:hypothetical protein n=1 Tax=Burkholderia multivorans TaxID=87883 RepID=UPI0011B1DCBA|nr:hypothetical protein [Burkholderia multivorans]